jgi:hypothetical protein
MLDQEESYLLWAHYCSKVERVRLPPWLVHCRKRVMLVPVPITLVRYKESCFSSASL